MVANKKGWLRIVEATIAILLIASFLTFFYIRSNQYSQKEKEIYNLEKIILDEIANNPELREKVLEENETAIMEYVKKRKPAGFNYTIKICDIGVVCYPSTYLGEEVYSDSRIISSTLKEYEPKQLRIFMWREK